MRSSCCWRVVGNKDNQSEMISVSWPVSPVRVHQRGCRSSSSAHWKRSKVTDSDTDRLLLSSASLLSLSGFWATWMRREQVSAFVEPTSWPMTGRREELGESEEGTEKKEGFCLCYFCLLTLPPPFLPFCLLFPFSLFLFKPSLICVAFRVKWYQNMLHLQITNIPLNSVLLFYFMLKNEKEHSW